MKFEPESINNDEFSGWVELKVPHARDRAKVYKTLKLKMNAKGEVETNEDISEVMIGMVDLAEEYLINAEITRKSDGKVFNKEDVFYEPELQALISEVGNISMSGFRPSKK
jgi:dihydroorotase